MTSEAAADFAFEIRDRKFGTVLADPPWRFDNREKSHPNIAD